MKTIDNVSTHNQLLWGRNTKLKLVWCQQFHLLSYAMKHSGFAWHVHCTWVYFIDYFIQCLIPGIFIIWILNSSTKCFYFILKINTYPTNQWNLRLSTFIILVLRLKSIPALRASRWHAVKPLTKELKSPTRNPTVSGFKFFFLNDEG